MLKQTKIVIGGGGFVGCTMALALARYGFSVILLDRQAVTHNDFDGRAYAIAFDGCQILQALNLWSDIVSHAQPILHIKVSDACTGDIGVGAAPFYVHFDYNELQKNSLGHIIEGRHLYQLLYNAIKHTPLIDHRREMPVVNYAVNDGGVRVNLSNGEQIKANLLIAADGRGSQIAHQSGIRRIEYDYQQAALVCALAHKKPHNATAHQFFTPTGPLAILPLSGNRSSIVWTEKKTRAQALSQLNEKNFLNCLRLIFGDFLGDICMVGKRFYYPLNLSIADRFIAQRMALVGDAAHGIHPLAGQGFNLGLRDVAALVEVITLAARRGEDIGAANVLQSYQRWRRTNAFAMAFVTHSINDIFSNDNYALHALRSSGLALVQTIAPLRRALMHKAAGLSGILPRLIQGRDI